MMPHGKMPYGKMPHGFDFPNGKSGKRINQENR